MKKAGIVLLIGRPNVGKSTLLNTLVGQKVSITSPKPQTTRFPIRAVLEDERGQLIFIDTPGIFKKAEDILSREVNRKTLATLDEEFDVVVYMVDPTRARSFEEGRVLGIVRKINKPVILVFNKIDLETKHMAEYAFIQDEVTATYKISALKDKHIKPFIEDVFSRVDREYPLVDMTDSVTPALNMNSRLFLQEIIREKVYLFTREEVPYKVGVAVEEIKERDNGSLYIKAVVYTVDKRYRAMLVGRQGRMVKEIGMAARKELERSTNKKVFLDLRIEANHHQQEILG